MNIQMATKVFLGLLLFFFFLYWTVWALVDPVTNTFSPSVHCLFILFMISVTVKRLLSLIGSHLFIFAFISIIREDWFQKKYYCSFRQSVLPMFSSRSFMVFGLKFRFLIHFEFIFVYGVRVFWLYSFTRSHPVFPAPLIKETIFSPLYILASFVVD